MKDIEDRRWNLSAVYPAPDSKEFEDDLAKLKSLADGIIKDIEEDSVCLDALIARIEELDDLSETMGTYAMCLVSVNTTDKAAVGALNRVDDCSVVLASVNTLFTAFVAAHPEQVAVFCEKNPDYGYVLSEIVEDSKHRMSRDQEELAAELATSGSDCFTRLQEAVSSSACADLDGEKLTVIQLRALATSADREKRRKAYEAELKVWKEHEISFAYALNSVKGTCLTLEKRRKWNSPIERSMAEARINSRILDALIGTIEKNLPMFRRYWDVKAKLLGIGKCAFYDLFAPVGSSDMEYTYEQARDFVIKQYGAFNPDMGKFAENAFANGWIDVFPRSGKSGGAYDCYLPKIRESRVMANFDGTYDGVSTFAHELGHAWHDRIVSSKPALLRTYPMTLAETASIFSEFITFRGALEQADDEQKVSLIEMFIQGASQVCVDILCRFYFEREVFRRRAEGELMPDELCEIMIDCQKKTYGEGLDPDKLHPYMWAVKSHYYSTEFSFYNYPYAFGQLFGLGLYARSQEDSSGIPFYKKYNELLSLTGQLPAKDVALTAGIDLEDPAFWQEGMDIISSYVDQLEKLAK